MKNLQQYHLRLFLLALLSTVACAFQPLFNRHLIRPATILRAHDFRANSDNNDMSFNILTDRLKNSPGYVSGQPINTTEQSRIELAKFVVATAVLLLTLNVKMKDVFSQLKLDKLSPGKMRDGSMGPVLLENGIEYTDYYAGSSGTTSTNEAPKKGEEVVVLAKLFYNGLQINKGLPNEVIPFTCVQGDSNTNNGQSIHQFLRTSFSPVFADVPMEGLTSALVGLKYGVRRKAILPANLAFGSKGFAPYIPPGAAVMYEITVSPKNDQQQAQDTSSSSASSRSANGSREDITGMGNDRRIVDTTIV